MNMFCRTVLAALLSSIVLAGAGSSAWADEPDSANSFVEQTLAQVQAAAAAGAAIPLATASAPAATICPAITTSCPAAATKCPTTATKCPSGATNCPAVATKCPTVDTSCPVVDTSCPPAATYSAWLGHSIAVSRKHYVQPLDSEFDAATGGGLRLVEKPSQAKEHDVPEDSTKNAKRRQAG